MLYKFFIIGTTLLPLLDYKLLENKRTQAGTLGTLPGKEIRADLETDKLELSFKSTIIGIIP